jgi:hypothetical protein
VTRISAFIGDLDRRVQLLDHDIAAEEERAQVFKPFDVAYAVLARTLAARRDDLKATVATLEKRLAERADKVPAGRGRGVVLLDDPRRRGIASAAFPHIATARGRAP